MGRRYESADVYEEWVGRNLAKDPVSLPWLVVRAEALQHNIEVLQKACDSRGFLLAPHVKTHMSPAIIARQVDAGAWGACSATVGQAACLLERGVPNVIIANEVVGEGSVLWLHGLVSSYPERRIYCLVDSVEGVSLLRSRFSMATPLRVLLEVGIGGRRAGVRSRERAAAIASEIHAADGLRFAGVELYEGAVAGSRFPGATRRVDEALTTAHEIAKEVGHSGFFATGERPILSAGGSIFFDRVAEILAPAADQFDVIVRSGAYVGHDEGHYATNSPLPLEPALEVWADVLSVPEPTVAILGAGKRDVPYDLGLPFVKHRARDGQLTASEGKCEVIDTNDHHAFVRVEPGFLAPGDIVRLGVSHPCTTFDKWSHALLLDRDDVLLEVLDVLL